MASNLDRPSFKISQINVLQGSTPTLKRSLSHLSVSDNSGELQTESDSCDEFPINWGPESSNPDVYFPGGWGLHGLKENPWSDKNKPTVPFKRYEDLTLNEVEQQGILTDRIFATCTSYLDKSPETNRFVLCKANLSKKFLKDIRIIQFHHYLQYVDLSHNDITNIECLSELPFLMYLDVSHNCLEELLNFKAPFYLTYVNYSYNCITRVPDLSSFWSLVHLDISHNHIKVIEGLQELRYLKNLNMSFNRIKRIENLNHMKLLTLNLESNSIDTFEQGEDKGLKTLDNILKLNLDYNHLDTIRFCEDITTLQSLSIQGNEIHDLLEISYLKNLNFLSEVDFRDNDVTIIDRYFETCIYNVKYISILDGQVIDAEVAARNVFEASIHTEAFRNASSALFIQQLNDPVLGLPIIPFDIPPPPVIILVGPPGSGKNKLLKKFCQLNSKHIIRGVSHTTRPKIEDKDQLDIYHHINLKEFWTMAHNGEFLTVSQILGHSFGFAQQELAKTVGKSLALILHMDLKGALTMRAQNMKCRLVLAMPSSQEVHISTLLQKYRIFNETVTQKGTLETESTPLKAKKFLEKYNTLAKELESTVDNASETWSDKGSLISRDDNDSATEFAKHITYGILKRSVNHSKSETPQSVGKSSVTFQSNLKKSRNVLHSSRSVTFTDLVQPQCNEKSISGTVIGENEVLSTLSHSSTHITDEKTENQAPTSTIIANSPTLEFLVNDVMKTRDSYLAFHQSNPGVISDVIFTDREEESLKTLKGLLKNCIKSQSQTAPTYEFKKDSAYQAIVATRLKSLHREIENEMSLGQKQLDEFIHKTKKGKPHESNLKWSTKDVIETMKSKRNQALNYKLPEDAKTYRSSSCDLFID